jgi:hypothetical protein
MPKGTSDDPLRATVTLHVTTQGVPLEAIRPANVLKRKVSV